MPTLFEMHLGWVMVATSLRHGRSERGGLTDETAIIVGLLVAAVAVGTIVYAFVSNRANDLESEWRTPGFVEVVELSPPWSSHGA